MKHKEANEYGDFYVLANSFASDSQELGLQQDHAKLMLMEMYAWAWDLGLGCSNSKAHCNLGNIYH